MNSMDSNKEKQLNEVKCPFCNNMISSNVTFCPKCGNKVDSVLQKKNEGRCPFCNGKINSDMEFCPNCGHKIESKKPQQKKTSGRNHVLLLWIGICFFVFIAIMLSISDNNNNDKKRTDENTIQEVEQPDSIQTEIIEKTNITFEELQKLEEYEGFKVRNMLVGYIQPSAFQWCLYIRISFENDTNKNLKPRNIEFTNVRFRLDNKILGSTFFSAHVKSDEDIMPGMILNAEAEKLLVATSMPKEKAFIDLLNSDGELIITIPVPNKRLGNELGL